MPLTGLVSPVTGLSSLSPLTVLVDHVGGLINHHRRGDREWTVSSELTLDLTPTAVSECHLRIGDVVIGSGAVRSFYVEAPAESSESPIDQGSMEAKFGPAAMMAVGTPSVDGEVVVLPQRSDRVLNNSIGVVHGGIASAGLEVVAAAAVKPRRVR